MKKHQQCKKCYTQFEDIPDELCPLCDGKLIDISFDANKGTKFDI